MMAIDLRSDTVTNPSPQMREAMFKAEVGDDVYMDDPTVKKLEEKAAKITGKEAGLFVSSGTMGNLVALLAHEVRGKAVMAGRESHIVNYEGGGVSTLAGAFCQQILDDSGLPDVNDLQKNFRNDSNVHYAESKLLCLENTHNRRGGMASTVAEMKVPSDWARKNGLSIHLDGARIFDAAIKCGENVADYCALVDSVQICLSKGLGAPIGSLICGTGEFIKRARTWRKRVGGGMRQVGIIAAAGIYALENNIKRLADDHENARKMKANLSENGIKTWDIARPTNMVYFEVAPDKTDEYINVCLNRGVKMGSTAPGVLRLVFHLDVSKEAMEEAAKIIVEEIKRMRLA